MATPHTFTPQTKELEMLHGLVVNNETVILTVTSNGCTSADSFKIDVAESLPPQVKVIRVIPDNCRGVSRPIDLKFPLKAFGGRKFRLANPLAVGPASAC